MDIHSSHSISTYKKSISDYLSVDPGSVSLFWKGRVALFSILKSLDIQSGDEIILPAFTCVVVPNAIIYAGARPVYVDIDPLTYNMDVKKMEEKITPKTKAIISQNTFGLSPDLDTIFTIARKNNIRVIDDCTHGIGGFYKGKPNGTVADASFFSTQWNKPFSTGIGGFIVVKEPLLMQRLSDLESQAISPEFRETLILNLLLFIRKNLLSPAIYWNAIRFYRFLSKKNLIIGSSQGSELTSPSMPAMFLKGCSELQAKEGTIEISKLDSYVVHRRKIARKYSEWLSLNNFNPAFEPDYAVHSFLKYPLLVRDREKFIAEAEKMNIELGDWFISPIHPIQKNFELWDYNMGSNPTAEDIASKMVNLPTHTGVNEDYLNRIFVFLNRHKHLIYA